MDEARISLFRLILAGCVSVSRISSRSAAQRDRETASLANWQEIERRIQIPRVAFEFAGGI